MAGLVSWLAALPSEDEEEDQVQQGRNMLPAAAVANAEFHIVEDDDVQVLNVVKYQEERGQPGALAAGQFFHPWQTLSGREKMPGAPQHGMDVIGDALYHFQDTPIPPNRHRHVEPIQRSQRRNDARNQLSRATASFDIESGRDVDGDFRYGGVAAQWRKDGISRELPSHFSRQEVSGTGRTSANVDQTHLNGRRVFQEHYCNVTGGQRPREFGILGGGPASQVREQGTIARDNLPQSLGPGFIVMERDPGLASTGCERLLFAQGRSTGRYVEQESFYIPGSPQPTVQGGHQGKGPVATRYSLESMVIGKTMDDWWSSLLEVVGTNLSGLHWDIVNFCKTLELTQEQKQIRREALEYVEKTVHELWPSAQVHLFGSTATGLALPWSDIDVAVISSHQDSSGQKSATVSWLSELGRYLKRHGQCKSLKQIPHAKVPLLKVVFRSGLACDISFDSHNGPRGVPVIRHFMQQYEALHPLCLVLKFFLGQQNLNELWTGGLGSFCLITMVVSHLQKLGTTGTGHDLGVLLLSFFTRYCTMHNYRTDVVSTRADICASKQAKGWVSLTDPELLSVEDPLDPTSDIAKGSYKIKDVRTIFLKAKTLLLTHWHHDNVLAKLVHAKEDENQRPNVQDEKYQGNKQRKQKKKRKKCDTAGSEMEDGQPVQLKRKQKAHCHKGGEAHCHKGGGLTARSMKQKKKLKKKNERADPKEGRRVVKLSDFLDSHSTGFESRLKRQRG